MRVKASLKSLKTRKGCRIVRRGRHILIINRENPRFKARQG